ncbi:ankyrin repeat-containing domain protein [Cercophora newfieldiana]|uniref:Ankyrin repeat-containing domain protein n=1 Tax=Cercophora newfieldiana TaxID=92897 RepID=A0AA39Y6R5_9PEZI|nr:ankyrin repeat-containing domain protein [Cercophora newfieldiana]
MLEKGGSTLRRIEDMVDNLTVVKDDRDTAASSEIFGEMGKRRKIRWLRYAPKVAKLRKELGHTRSNICQLLISQNIFLSADISYSVEYSQTEIASQISSLSTSIEASHNKMLSQLEDRLQSMEKRMLAIGTRHRETRAGPGPGTTTSLDGMQQVLSQSHASITPGRSSQCKTTCMCSCHRATNYAWKMTLLRSVVGVVAVAYTNWTANPCSDASCQDTRRGQAAQDLCFTYQLPDWLARTSLSVFFSSNLNGSPHMNLRMYHRREWGGHSPVDIVARGNLEEVKTSLRKGVISVYDLYGPSTYTILWIAWVSNKTVNYEVVQLLLQAGADPFQKSEFSQGMSVVSAAFERLVAEPKTSQALAKILPIQKYLEDSDFNLLHFAVLGIIHVDLEKMLRDPEHLSNINAKTGDGFTALHLAALSGNFPAAKLLIRSGADLKVRTTNKGFTPLYYAARFNHFQVAQALLNAGANVAAEDSDGVQAIHGTALFNQGDNSKIFDLLLKHGADIHARPKGSGTPLQFVITRGSPEAARFLLQNGADSNSRRRTGTPAIIQVIYSPSQRYVMAEILLEFGADVNVTDKGDESVLHALAEYGSAQMIRTFIGRGFSKVATALKDKNGKTPLNVLNARNPSKEIREAFERLLDNIDGPKRGAGDDEDDDEDEFFDAVDTPQDQK